MHGEEPRMGNEGLLWEYLDKFLNKKITSLSDMESRGETTKCFRRLMMNCLHVLTEKVFFEIFHLYNGFNV